MSGFEVGSLTVVPLLDGTGLECARDVLSRDANPDAWAEHEDLVDDNGDIHLTLGGFLIRTGDRVVLIDVGVGTLDNGRYRGGLFLENLRQHGVEPEEVTDVAFTHLHFDHVGWATQKGRVVFTNATHHVHSADWQHFVDDVNAQPGATRKLLPLESRLALFDTDTTIAPGLDARPAVGHTPGSTVYVVSEGGAKAVLLGDVAHSEVELTEPGWSFKFDWRPARATAAREELVAEFVDTDTLVFAGHLADLRPGRLTSLGDGVHWQTA